MPSKPTPSKNSSPKPKNDTCQNSDDAKSTNQDNASSSAPQTNPSTSKTKPAGDASGPSSSAPSTSTLWKKIATNCLRKLCFFTDKALTGGPIKVLKKITSSQNKPNVTILTSGRH